MVPENKFGMMLGLSIAELVLCCPIAGIIGIIFSVLANNAHKEGDYDGYSSKAKAVKLTLIIGLAVGLIAAIAIIIMYGALIATAVGNSTY